LLLLLLLLGAAYHKGCDLQPRHWLNISREVAILNTLRDLK
jgi:hypothetical protein